MRGLKDWIAQLRILDPKHVKVVKAEVDVVDVEICGRLYHNVKPRRPFPLTHPEYVIFFKEDDEEVGILRDYRKLDKESRAHLERVLNVIYFMPQVKRILSINTSGWTYKWLVETDKGIVNFETWSRCIRIIKGKKVIIYDIHGGVYCINDISKLDTRSLLWLSVLM